MRKQESWMCAVSGKSEHDAVVEKQVRKQQRWKQPECVRHTLLSNRHSRTKSTEMHLFHPV